MPTRTQHTPLPWIQHIEGTHRQIFLWAEAPPLCVAMIKRDGPNTEQDLVNGDFIQEACNNYERLKASNAELLEVLKITEQRMKLVMDELIPSGIYEGRKGVVLGWFEDSQRKASAAILKAGGKS